MTTMDNKVVIVTAASRGIGAGCAKELAAQGYKVSLTALIYRLQTIDTSNQLNFLQWFY